MYINIKVYKLFYVIPPYQTLLSILAHYADS